MEAKKKDGAEQCKGQEEARCLVWALREQAYLEVSSTVADTAVSEVKLQVCRGRLRPLARVDVQDGGSCLRVWQREDQLSVKPGSTGLSLGL